MYVKVMLTLLVALAAVVALTLGRPPSPADPLAGRVEVPNPLNTVIDELKLKDASLEAAVEALQRMTGANIVVNWAELGDRGIRKSQAVDADLRGVTLLAALKVLFDQGDPVRGQHGEYYLPRYACEFGGGVVTVFDPHARPEQLLVRTYDVRDLLEDGYHPLPGPPREAGESADGEPEVDGPAGRLARLVELVKSHPAWADQQWSGTVPVGTVTPDVHGWGGRLVVVQTAERQRSVESLLRELRRAR
jgi:hypothetical protein